MKALILTALLTFGMQDFPELSDGDLDAELIEPDEGSDEIEGDALQPSDDRSFEELAPDEVEVDDVKPNWDTKTVRPKAIEPSAPSQRTNPPATSGPDDLPPPILSPGVATSDDDLNAGPVPDLSGGTNERPFIAGYKDFLWMDSLNTVRRAFGADNPLVEQSGNRYLISEKCEGEEASVIFIFNAQDELSGVACQFAKGVVDYKPDHALYQKVRSSIVRQWGEPQVTNESPAPDSPVQAAQWKGKAGTATLSFDLEKKNVQLRVERNNGN